MLICYRLDNPAFSPTDDNEALVITDTLPYDPYIMLSYAKGKRPTSCPPALSASTPVLSCGIIMRGAQLHWMISKGRDLSFISRIRDRAPSGAVDGL